EAFMQEVQRASRRAAVAGGLLLTMLQLHRNGYCPSLNQAIPLVTARLPKWQQLEGPYWSKTCHFEHRPRPKTTMLQSNNEFRNVTHFWGEFLHGQQHERQDIWSGAPETLPTFLSSSEAILELACPLPSFAGHRRFASTASEVWSFIM